MLTPSRSPAATSCASPTSSPAEAEAILDLAVELRAEPKQPLLLRRDARPVLLEALDAHARLLLGRDGAARRRRDPAHAGGAAALARRVAARHGARSLALPRRARRPHARARGARGVGGVGVDPGDQRADRGRASVPGARRRADDPRPARRASTACASRGSATARTCSSRSPRSASCSATRSSPPAPTATRRAGVETVRDPREAVAGADVVVTDTWISMGQEHERAQRLADLEPYRLDERSARARRARGVRHALPAGASRRGDRRRTCSTASARRSGTRRRTASTSRRRCSRCCSAPDAQDRQRAESGDDAKPIRPSPGSEN